MAYETAFMAAVDTASVAKNRKVERIVNGVVDFGV
jgi:hypothetical protein